MIGHWNSDEDEALQHLPLRAQVIYLRGIRRFVDANGIAGIKRRISWKSLSEVAEVVPERGSHQPLEIPSRKAVRCAIEQLEKAEIIKQLPESERFKGLVFKCLMADQDKSVQMRRGQGGAKEGPCDEGPYEKPDLMRDTDGGGAKEGPCEIGAFLSEEGPASPSPSPNTPSLRSGGEACPQNQQIISLPSSASGDESPSQPPKKRGLSPEMQEACRATWKAYSDAYFARYGVEPVRNPKVNRNIVDFVKRIGMTDAPHVAAWYLTHTSAYYVRQGHSVGALLADAEKLRTEWATGIRMTDTKARQSDRAGTTASHVQEILAERRAKR